MANSERNTGFRKVWFSGLKGRRTAGLVLDADKVHTMTLQEISRLFPHSEWPKMRTLHFSPVFENFDTAFSYEVPGNE